MGKRVCLMLYFHLLRNSTTSSGCSAVDKINEDVVLFVSPLCAFVKELLRQGSVGRN